jgi:rhodanese-related sulfurtransferase
MQRKPISDTKIGVRTFGLKMDYEITPETVNEEVKAQATDAFTLLDVREPWEFETASIAGSKHIPMGDIPSRAHQELDPEDHIVVVCHHGVRSMTVTNWLRQQGFEKAQSMRGGIDAWSRQIDPKVPTY